LSLDGGGFFSCCLEQLYVLMRGPSPPFFPQCDCLHRNEKGNSKIAPFFVFSSHPQTSNNLFFFFPSLINPLLQRDCYPFLGPFQNLFLISCRIFYTLVSRLMGGVRFFMFFLASLRSKQPYNILGRKLRRAPFDFLHGCVVVFPPRVVFFLIFFLRDGKRELLTCFFPAKEQLFFSFQNPF